MNTKQKTLHFKKQEAFSNSTPELAAVLSWILGIGFGIGFTLFIYSNSLWDLGIAMMGLSFFHLWEYLYVCLYHPDELTADSFLLNHSKEYTLAFVILFSEYFIEFIFFPFFQKRKLFVFIGTMVMIAGQFIRTLAMITAGSNFRHLIEESKRPDHKLVTTGIYSVSRHPSYFGWFYWANSIPVILGCPISLFGFIIATWKFFDDRIKYEEETLKEMFPNDYERYKKSVPTRIPFIP